jgi:hypothetical protein
VGCRQRTIDGRIHVTHDNDEPRFFLPQDGFKAFHDVGDLHGMGR